MPDHHTDDDTARSDHFKPKWFLALLRGELGLGETYWIGGIGTQLVFVPFWFFVLFVVEIASPTSRDYFLMIIAVFSTLYSLALFRAVFLTAIQNKTAGVWRWVAIFVSAINVLGLCFYASVISETMF